MKQKTCLTLIFTLLISFLSHDMLLARAFQSTNYSLAVIPLAVRGRISSDASMRISERLQEELIRTRMFTVTNLATVQSTLRDNGIIPSNCGSMECGLQAGRILGARLAANGEIRRVGSRIMLDVRILHIASGKVVQSVSEQYYDGNVNEILQDMPSIVQQLVGRQAAGSAQQPQDPGMMAEDEPIITTEDPDDVFTIGDSDEFGDTQPGMRQNGNSLKWVMIGLVVAGGVGAGVLLANKNGDENGGDNGDGGPVTKLPGHPIFP